MVRVKICGITNAKDAEDAVSFGADALGFIFAKSPRRIAPAEARKIIKTLGPWVAAVGVFVNESPEKIKRIASFCGLSVIQLHGDESPADVKKLSDFKLIKAFRVGEGFDFSFLRKYAVDAFLFDTKIEGLFGGSGRKFDWNVLKSKKMGKPLILSGGLDPSNVRKAVSLLFPYGVDVSSGVERSPGKKDSEKVKEFIRNAKKAA